MKDYYDIKPITEVATISTNRTDLTFDIADVLPVVGMSEIFARKVIGKKTRLTENMVVELLEQDAFSETFVPRSRVLSYLRALQANPKKTENAAPLKADNLYVGDALELIEQLADNSVQCVVTSTPYWAMRMDSALRCILSFATACSLGNR